MQREVYCRLFERSNTCCTTVGGLCMDFPEICSDMFLPQLNSRSQEYAYSTVFLVSYITFFQAPRLPTTAPCYAPNSHGATTFLQVDAELQPSMPPWSCRGCPSLHRPRPAVPRTAAMFTLLQVRPKHHPPLGWAAIRPPLTVQLEQQRTVPTPPAANRLPPPPLPLQYRRCI